MTASLSIIVPIYNAAKYLDVLLQSIEKQNYRDFECIMVNDGSTDSSGEICKKIASQDARFILISKENAGVSAARNTGLEQAKGEYIAFADADDFLEYDMYQTLIEAMHNTGAAIASCSFVHEEKISDLTHYAKAVFKVYKQPIELFYEETVSLNALWNKVYKRSTIGNVRFAEDISYSEDQLFVAEVLLKASSVAITSTPKYHYKKNENSLSRYIGDYKFWSGYVRAMDRIYQMIENSSASAKTKNKAYEKYGRAIFSLLRFSIQKHNGEMYKKIKQEYREDVEKFFALPYFPITEQITYRTYWWGYFWASLFHGHKGK